MLFLYVRRNRLRVDVDLENGQDFDLETNRPITLDLIDHAFPAVPYNSSLLSYTEPICVICLEEYAVARFTEERLVRKMRCGHIYHSQCIDDWLLTRALHPECPQCKGNPFLECEEHTPMIVDPPS